MKAKNDQLKDVKIKMVMKLKNLSRAAAIENSPGTQQTAFPGVLYQYQNDNKETPHHERLVI